MDALSVVVLVSLDNSDVLDRLLNFLGIAFAAAAALTHTPACDDKPCSLQLMNSHVW